MKKTHWTMTSLADLRLGIRETLHGPAEGHRGRLSLDSPH
jgi:hypothetical protein